MATSIETCRASTKELLHTTLRGALFATAISSTMSRSTARWQSATEQASPSAAASNKTSHARQEQEKPRGCERYRQRAKVISRLGQRGRTGTIFGLAVGGFARAGGIVGPHRSIGAIGLVGTHRIHGVLRVDWVHGTHGVDGIVFLGLEHDVVAQGKPRVVDGCPPRQSACRSASRT